MVSGREQVKPGCTASGASRASLALRSRERERERTSRPGPACLAPRNKECGPHLVHEPAHRPVESIDLTQDDCAFDGLRTVSKPKWLMATWEGAVRDLGTMGQNYFAWRSSSAAMWRRSRVNDLDIADGSGWSHVLHSKLVIERTCSSDLFLWSHLQSDAFGKLAVMGDTGFGSLHRVPLSRRTRRTLWRAGAVNTADPSSPKTRSGTPCSCCPKPW